jgi:hypothetical protein
MIAAVQYTPLTAFDASCSDRAGDRGQEHAILKYSSKEGNSNVVSQVE